MENATGINIFAPNGERTQGFDIESISSDRNKVIDGLIEKFQSYSANVYLRGSIVREEYPYADADLIVIAAEDEKNSELPEKILDIPLYCKVMSLSQLAEYCQTTPRAWSFLNENIKLSGNNKEIDLFVGSFREYYMSNLLDDHLLHLSVEHKVYKQRQDIKINKDYYSLKRLPGSKRSIMRAVYMVKAMYPELYNINSTEEVLALLPNIGLAPKNIPEAANTVLSGLAAGNCHDSEWKYAAETIDQWVEELYEYSAIIARHTLPVEYLQIIDNALSGYGGILSKANTLTPYRRWTALLAYSANENSDSAELFKIWQLHKGDYRYKVLERFLLRNQRFPINLINLEEITDYHSLFTIARRKQQD